MDKNLLIRFFEGQATTDEEMKVRKWMEASTENRRTYFKERKMYDMTLLLSKDTKKETVSQSSKKKFKFRKFIEIAAVAAITLVITLFYKNQERQEYWLTAQKISVPAGQRINLELSDGTKVWLNSRTKIEGIKEQMDTIANRYNKWLYLFLNILFATCYHNNVYISFHFHMGMDHFFRVSYLLQRLLPLSYLVQNQLFE